MCLQLLTAAAYIAQVVIDSHLPMHACHVYVFAAGLCYSSIYTAHGIIIMTVDCW